MEKVKKYIVKKDIENFLKKGDIFIECFDKLNHIVSETEWFTIEVSYLDKYGGLEKYFDFVGMVDIKETVYFGWRSKELLREKENIKEKILSKKEEIKECKKRISKIDKFLKIG